MHGQLPAPIVNGTGDIFWKWKDFQLSTAHDLELVSGHTAYCHASLIDLYLHAKFYWNRRNFLCTDRHLRPASLVRLWRVDLKSTEHLLTDKMLELFVLASESRHKATTPVLLRVPRQMKKNEARPVVVVSALCFLQCFYTAGWVAGRTSDPYKPMHLSQEVLF